jgi:hypothetical protein
MVIHSGRASGLLGRLWGDSRNGVTIPPPVKVLPLAPEPVLAPEVEFAAYTEDCQVFGFLRSDEERMTDALNGRDSFDLVDVLIVALDDGRAITVKEFSLARDELLGVRATGPRGNVGRRGRMRAYPVTLQTGPYLIHGHLHGPPGTDPLRGLRLRKPMVPLTEAWISYRAAGRDHRGRVGTMIVNRELLDWIDFVRDDEVSVPNLPAEPFFDPRAKDLTGAIWTRPEAPP